MSNNISQKTISKIKKILEKYSDKSFSYKLIKSLCVKDITNSTLAKIYTNILSDLILDLTQNDNIYQKVIKSKKDIK